MNEETLLSAIGMVGDDLITRADSPVPAAHGGKALLRWGALAACVCLLIGAARLLKPALSGAKTAAPTESPAAAMETAEAAAEYKAVAEEAAEVPAEMPAMVQEEPAAEEKEAGMEKEKSEPLDEEIRENITVLGRNYEEILDFDPDYTPAELTESNLEFYLERGNGDRVYVLTWTETPAGVESWPYTIAVFRDGSVPVQYRYIGEQVYYDSLPESMRIGTANLKRVGVDDPLTFFHEDFPEESLGKPWQVLADGSRLYVVSEPVLTPNELTEGLSYSDLLTVDRITDSLRLQADEMSDGGLTTVDSALVLLFADDDRAAAYLIMASPIVCFNQRYTEVPADDPILSVFSAEAEQEQADGAQPESPWVSPWCTLSDGSRVDVLSKSVATVEDMVFPEYVIRSFDYGHSVVYRFSGS